MPSDSEFEQFVADVEPRLRRAMIVGFGPDLGRQSALEALSWAWENWDRVQAMDNPAGYLYRVATTRALRARPRDLPMSGPAIELTPDVSTVDGEWFEPGLLDALDTLSDVQRSAVVLVHGYGYTLREAAEILEVASSTVYKNCERAMARLRQKLEPANADPN